MSPPTPLSPRLASTKSEVSSSRKALYGLTLDISSLVLTTLRDAARLAPVPYLMDAADLALGILDIIQSMKDCKEGFKRLASDSCGLVYAIVGAHSEAVMPEDLSIHVKELLRTLKSIHAFSQKELKRKPLLRIIQHNSDRGKILEYREALRQSLDVFGLQSTVSIQENIARIIQKQNEIVQHLERQCTQDSILKELLTQTLENARTELLFTSSPNDSSPPPFPIPRSKNPFRNLHRSHTHPLNINTLNIPSHHNVPSLTAPNYCIAGDFISEDRRHYIENSNSNNTTTTNISGSNNDMSTRIFAGPRARYNRSRSL